MPASELFLSKIGVIAALVESTEGTASAPLATNAFLAEDIVFTPSVQMNERNVVAQDLSPYPDVPGKRSATLTFKTLLKGSGVAGTAPDYGDLFTFCKYNHFTVAGTRNTYTPLSSGDPSATIVVYKNIDAVDGKKYVLNGCRGNWTMNFVIGETMYVNWSFTAADWTETDSAPLTGMSYDTSTPVVFQGGSFTLNSYAFSIGKFDIDAGNVISLRQDMTATSSSGHLSANIVDAKPVGSLDPLDILVATNDIFGRWRAGTLNGLSIIAGVAGNRVTITAPEVQYTTINPVDRNGFRALDVGIKFIRDTVGNDHLKVNFD